MNNGENIQRLTFNAQLLMNFQRAPLSMLDVEGWMLKVSCDSTFLTGGRA
jgi:hypothetical protein